VNKQNKLNVNYFKIPKSIAAAQNALAGDMRPACLRPQNSF